MYRGSYILKNEKPIIRISGNRLFVIFYHTIRNNQRFVSANITISFLSGFYSLKSDDKQNLEHKKSHNSEYYVTVVFFVLFCAEEFAMNGGNRCICILASNQNGNFDFRW